MAFKLKVPTYPKRYLSDRDCGYAIGVYENDYDKVFDMMVPISHPHAKIHREVMQVISAYNNDPKSVPEELYRDASKILARIQNYYLFKDVALPDFRSGV